MSWHVVFWYVVYKHRCVSGVIVSCVNALIHFPFTCLSLKPKTKHLVPVLVHVFLRASNATSGACSCTCVFVCQQCCIWCLFLYMCFCVPAMQHLVPVIVHVFLRASNAASGAYSGIDIFCFPEMQHYMELVLQVSLYWTRHAASPTYAFICIYMWPHLEPLLVYVYLCDQKLNIWYLLCYILVCLARNAASWTSSSIWVFVWRETQHLIPVLIHIRLHGQKRGMW